ncbi:hypothetical protein PoMZ_03583 [Pyricularia oryzae]|uniref:Pathogen-related protein n=1 Tax=Pyricularia oryzae TaxID=318829 RepID=A0A4P7N7F9_PYROR|nr:hypothetical protein PoMZ_03583 [Pyricularia oryzae]
MMTATKSWFIVLKSSACLFISDLKSQALPFCTMASTEEATPALPDYVTDENAVTKDKAKWRYGRAPDYSKTRKIWAESKKSNHTAGSLPDLIEKLVKNWEVEASFKVDLADWRTVDRETYCFSVNGGPPQTGQHMLEVGTYNALIQSNEFYCPAHSTFEDSHKTFKRMMPTFAWEVLEVYSGPPVAAFRWRHWGTFKENYKGVNGKGEKVTMKAHGGTIDIEGIAVATLNEKLQIKKVDIWFDPMAMFHQMKEVLGDESVKEIVHPAAQGEASA